MSAQLSFPSGANNNTKWKKRKRDNTINNNNTPNTKKHRQQSLQQQEEDDEDEEDLNEDDEEEIEPEIEEDEDLQPIPSTVPPPQPVVIQNPKEEVLSDGGNRISDFPIVIQHTVNRFHSSVLSIVSAERQAQFPNNYQNPNPNFFLIENISYGQLQALSSVPADNLSLATSTSDLNDRSDAAASYVCTPPPIMEGRGVVKRFDGNNNGPALVVPMHADWFTPNTVHRLERQVVPYFFSGKSADHTPEKYMECRNRVVAKYMENPETRLWTGDCQNLVDGIDVHDLNRIVRFLDHWGIINYSAPAPNRDPRIGGPFLREESNGEIHIPSPALRSIYSLIHFDKPKSRIRPTDICPMLSSDGDEVADLDQRIRERLTETHCHYCSQPLPRIYYQSQKESDILLCSDCFHEGRFVVGHSSIDFMKVDSAKALCDLDGDSWTDQETLLLLEAVEVYHDNWNDIADHVGTKSKAQCILHFVRLPMEDGVLENIDVPIKLVSSNTPNLDDGGTPYPRSNGDSARLYPQDLDSESRLPFANSRNPVMALVAFLASAVGPRVAAACAHASLAELSKEENQLVASGNKIQTDGSVDRISTEGMWSREGGHHGSPRLSHKKENQDGSNALSSAPLSTESVKVAAKVGLAAAAMKAKLFADHEEREIQRMAASIINHQLKRLELKLKQFAEVETLLMKEGEQVEKARQRLAAERVHVISTRFVPGGALNANIATLQGAVAAPVGNNLVNSSRQVGMPGGSPVQTNMIPGGYGNNTAVATHPHMSFMPRQPMFSYGPRLPLSAIHPSSSSLSSAAAHPATTMYNAAPPAGNAPLTLGHTMLRPVSGNNANVG
ncbi:hypothetical protein MKW94_024745 [Papaver nudicaule]|uniref:SWI/SNF complex subunit SWI3C n=1 Tax=Papaver nudicaule TaxID=74823 RepID=A0AA41W355_PAPNU|nr:hypothetical protein [Papaver nudicaule]